MNPMNVLQQLLIQSLHMPLDRFSGPMVTTPPTQPRYDYCCIIVTEIAALAIIVNKRCCFWA
jgi:hypothetical protein